MNRDEKYPGCGVAVGQSHTNECDVERCSASGCQRISYDCEEHDPMVSVWVGEMPEEDDVLDGPMCEGCGLPAAHILAKVSIDGFDDAEWERFSKGWLRINPDDMRSVRILCSKCAGEC